MVGSKISFFLSLFSISVVFLSMSGGANAQDTPADYLKAHNDVRKAVGVPPLSWDNNLANDAQAYANGRVGNCRYNSFSGGPYGENVFWGWGRVYNAADAVASWVSSGQYYDRKSNSCQPFQLCLPYLQVVWKTSVKVGCGRVRCNNGDFFIYCRYSPSGNLPGQGPF